jgi:diguanylate cyclase (GGDEF)-like protein
MSEKHRRWARSLFQCSRAFPPLLLAIYGPVLAQVPQLPTLTSATQVHSLTYEQSLLPHPVRLRNEQVLYYNPTLGNLFVQDSTRGVYVDTRDLPSLPLHSGDLLDIEGTSGPGGYAPVVEHAHIHKVGVAPLPVAHRYSLDHLLTGAEDCQWVEAEGVVRAVEEATQITRYANQAASGGTNLQVTIATGAGRLDVIVREPGGLDYHTLVDAKVLVRGVMGPRFNQQRQLTGIHMFAQSLGQFQILQHGPSNPFSLPIRRLGDVMRFAPDLTPEHRIRVRGVVTANRGGSLVSIAHGDYGLFIRTLQGRDLQIGDLVDIAGFASMGEYTPVLEDVVYRKLGTGSAPGPVAVTAEQLFKGDADARLVTVQAELLKQTRTLQEHTLLLTANDRTFSAVLAGKSSSESVESIAEGSVLELTGTCFVEVYPNKTPKGVQLLLRSPADITVLRRPSWWTTRHALAALAGLFITVIGAFAWITLLRRRVRTQTDALRKAEEEGAVISELAHAMQEVAMERNFSTRVSFTGNDRIAQLGGSFNKMLCELETGDLAKKQVEAMLQQQALTDELTGLPNRRLLSEGLSHALAIAERERHVVALLYIDLDGFKVVNDSLGHTVGDLLLVQVAQSLRARIRKSDTLARLGGDEFTVLLNRVRSREEAELVATALLESLARPFIVEGHEIVIGASIGISVFPEHGADVVTLLQHADSAMYAAKKNGKNQIKSFTPELGSIARERMTLENQLRGAISRGEIHLHYQPEFDVTTGRLVRFEALARWTHPTLGEIPASKFIAIAEESGQIITLGAFLMEMACTEALRWQTIAGYPLQVAVNVSSLQFSRPTIVDEVAQTLQYTGLQPSLLQLELTESIMLSGTVRAATTMQHLRELGVSLAIDDFGTGYSCLSYLPRLPFNVLKIDRSFVRELRPGSGAEAIVRSLITLAHSLQMNVIVEGIETVRQLEMVKMLGGHEAQGYLLGLPTADPEAQLAAHAKLTTESSLEMRAASQTAGS